MIGVGRSDAGDRRATPAAVGGPGEADLDHERACWIAFSLVPGLGPAGFAVLVRRHGSAAAAWAAGVEALLELPRCLPKRDRHSRGCAGPGRTVSPAASRLRPGPSGDVS